VGWAPDGIVEAIESKGSAWVVGVQWHAEGLTDSAEQHALFGGFMEAADPARRDRRAA
jgi:putative glutamine amidotransferase